MTPERFVAFLFAWGLWFTIIGLLVVATRRRPEPLSFGEGVTILLASSIGGAVGALTSLHGLQIIDPWTETVRMSVIILRAISTLLFFGVLLNVLGWPPPLLRRWI